MQQQNFEVSLSDYICLPESPPPKFLTYLNDNLMNNIRLKPYSGVKMDHMKKRHHTNKFTVNHYVKQQNTAKMIGLQQIILPKAKVLGKMIDGKLHGYCEVTYNDGSIFKGQYNFGSKVSGEFLFYDNSKYEGQFLNQNFHGQGKLFFPSGKIIQGRWNQSKLQGNGKIIYINGDIYYGQIKDLKKHGNGCLFFSNNNKYIGQFYEGYIQGKGSFYKGQTLLYQGEWINGRLVKKY